VRRALAQLARFDPTRLDLTLPRPWVCALLVAAFLGFGVLVGRVSSSPEPALSASVHPQLRLILPAASDDAAGQSAPPGVVSTPTPAAGSAEGGETSEPGGEGGANSGGSGGAATSPATDGQGSGSGKGAAGKAGGGSKGKGNGGAGSGKGGGETGAEGDGASGKLPPVKHVFVILLADQPYASVFGPSSSAPYLAKTLERRGELLVRYYAVAHDELANEIALVSGQGPTPQTEVNCPTYTDVAPASGAANGQVLGQGCVYPASTETVAGQLSAKHLTWKAYVEGASGGSGAAAGGSQVGGGCAHPTLGSADPTVDQTLPAAPTTAGPAADQAPAAYEAAAGSAYATFRNPFLYFHGVIDGSACAADDAGIGQLTSDLASARGAPSLSYIVPSLCDDGNPTPCAPGRPAGLAPAEAFLRKVVPPILASKSYKHGGLLVITVDQAPSSGIYADSSSCCGQPAFPALPSPPTLPGGGSARPAGGGQVGALLLSPYVKPGTTSQETFNHFSLLRTIEDLFGLRHLGYAALPKVEAFGASVFNAGG
jgi:phosphatidylinositol-3-phosphatase